MSIKATRSSLDAQITSLSPLFPSNCISAGCAPGVTESCVSSPSTIHLTFSSDIQRITQITDSAERRDYVLNLFEKMEDANVDPEDYYDRVIDADAQAALLTESPEA